LKCKKGLSYHEEVNLLKDYRMQ